ncbi:proline-rich extensin-like protein EPR1 [Bactrocera tryoni]|uniref:proline-rich extensin-like protein EPR1 n=1 Tax=Bactrocera tryoni TaxID=59916 RepID=UPI001A989D42|nr:proline-rich extensin-like protein EPR1 [Bactrocera tryoni]
MSPKSIKLQQPHSPSRLLIVVFALIAAVTADISHSPSNEYLPPIQDVAPVEAPVSNLIQDVALPASAYVTLPVEASPAHILADDGYRYKTHRRVVYRRNRRDVSHLPSNEYLPPVQEAPVAAPSSEYLPPVQQAAPAPVPVEAVLSHILADDGYRYKTHRRVVYRRNRRDVSHLPPNEYLPPVQEAPVAAPSNDYLPPVQQAAPAPAPVPVPVEVVPSHVLADDGYRYKTHRRVVYRRNRRDVSHLPSNEYLPPVQEVPVTAPSNEYLPPLQQAAPAPAPVEVTPAHVLADDGYRYKTHRRVVYRRNRRDVSHLPSNEYLPPVQQAPVAAPSNEYLPPVQQAAPAPAPVPVPVEVVPSHVLASDGYRYKTHRRVVYRRNRRDVSHLPPNEYLPPVQEVPVAAPSNDYLPPVQQAAPAPAPVEVTPAHVLSDDGYRYKTHRRVIYRRH